MKGDTKYRKWGGLNGNGHSRSLKISAFDKAHASSY